MRRIVRDGAGLFGALATALAITAVFRSKHQLVEPRIEVAFGPAVVTALFDVQQLLGRQRGLLLQLIDRRPIRVQLVAAVLRDEQTPGRIDGKAFGIAYSGRESFGRRKLLIGLVRVVAPNAAARRKLRTRTGTGRLERAVLRLAGVGRSTHVYIHEPGGVDYKRVHRVIASERQTGHDGLRSILRHDGSGGQGGAHYFVVALGIKVTMIETDAGTARAARLHSLTESQIDVGLALAGTVLQGDQEAAGVRRVIAVIHPRPGVHVNDSARSHHHMTGVTDPIGKNRCAKSG